MIENETTTMDPQARENIFGLLLKWRDQAKESANVYKLSEMMFSEVWKEPEIARLCHDMRVQVESNAARMEKLLIGFNAPKK